MPYRSNDTFRSRSKIICHPTPRKSIARPSITDLPRMRATAGRKKSLTGPRGRRSSDPMSRMVIIGLRARLKARQADTLQLLNGIALTVVINQRWRVARAAAAAAPDLSD